jgi:hypothetical protein
MLDRYDAGELNQIKAGELLGVSERTFRGLRLQIPPSPLRPHFVKARVKVRHYPDGTYAIFHGPRRIGRYDAEGLLSDEFAPSVRQAERSTPRPTRQDPQRRFATPQAVAWPWRGHR